MTLPQVFQFFVGTTVVGILLTFLFQWFRDRASRREILRATKREFIKQVDELYRSSKQIKRLIKSRSKLQDGDLLIEAKFFESRMDEL
jgi:hypothetical protein